MIDISSKENKKIKDNIIEEQDEKKELDSLDDVLEDANQTGESSSLTNSSSNSNSTNDTKNYSGEKEYNESDVVTYFKTQEALAMGNQNDPTIRERLKSGVNNIYNFLFQGGTIYGKTFHELSSSANTSFENCSFY